MYYYFSVPSLYTVDFKQMKRKEIRNSSNLCKDSFLLHLLSPFCQKIWDGFALLVPILQSPLKD